MPFTPTHLLAVLPLRRWPALPFAALAIGSTVPDLCLYLPFRVEGLYRDAHSLHGPATVNLAAGAVLYLLWRLLLDKPLRDLLPAAVRRRIAPTAPLRVTLAGAVAVVVALVLGAATHVFWDTFTHAHRWGVDAFPQIFYAEIGVPGDRKVPLYKLIQHGSSVVGLPLLALWAVSVLGRTRPGDPTADPTLAPTVRHATWVVLLLLAGAAAVNVGLTTDASLAWRLHHLATRGGAALAAGLLIYAVCWRVMQSRSRLGIR